MIADQKEIVSRAGWRGNFPLPTGQGSCILVLAGRNDSNSPVSGSTGTAGWQNCYR